MGLVAAGDCEDVSGGVGTVVRSQAPRNAAAAMSAIAWMNFPFMLPPMLDVRPHRYREVTFMQVARKVCGTRLPIECRTAPDGFDPWRRGFKHHLVSLGATTMSIMRRPYLRLGDATRFHVLREPYTRPS